MHSSGTGSPRPWHQFKNAFSLAADSLRAHKLRSFLTLLGVIIGVACVILAGAAIAGLGVYAEESTAKAFGSESFMVAQIAATGRLSRRQYFDKMRRNKPIYNADAQFLESVNGDRVLYSRYRNHACDVKHGNLTCEQTTIIGASADLAGIRCPQVDRFMITAKARTGMRDEAYQEVEGAMRRAHHLATTADYDFAISTPAQMIQQFDRITGLIGLVAIAISGPGLLVGGIGVMNIMLMSATERTREIGVRKALGARRRDIIAQFLVEATTLTGLGGVLGITIAVLIGAVVPSSKVPAWALITGFSKPVAVGVFFGVWPAVKAARLDPVEALRYE